MGDKFSLIDLGNISEPAAGVVNNFLDKISSALGWMVTPKNIKPAIIEANKSIIEEIANREDINPIERAAIVNNFRKNVKEYKNQVDIMRIAVEHLEANFVSGDVHNDWISFFFNKIKDVTEDYMKEIWGKILAGEFNKPGSFTKQFLHTLSIMDSNMAKRFCKIRNSCFYTKPYLYMMVYRTNGEDINNIKKYEEMQLFIKDFRELDNFGLIQYKFSAFHVWKIKNNVFYYGNKRIKLDTNDKAIALGNVALTDIGKQFCRIVPMEYDDKVLEICIDSWKQLGYNPTIEIIENNDELK